MGNTFGLKSESEYGYDSHLKATTRRTAQDDAKVTGQLRLQTDIEKQFLKSVHANEQGKKKIIIIIIRLKLALKKEYYNLTSLIFLHPLQAVSLGITPLIYSNTSGLFVFIQVHFLHEP